VDWTIVTGRFFIVFSTASVQSECFLLLEYSSKSRKLVVGSMASRQGAEDWMKSFVLPNGYFFWFHITRQPVFLLFVELNHSRFHLFINLTLDAI
jgi:hypothetical protein